MSNFIGCVLGCVKSSTNTAYTSTTGQADGSSGYGNESLSSDIHTESTAPEKFKYKFNYYFKNYPEQRVNHVQQDNITFKMEDRLVNHA